MIKPLAEGARTDCPGFQIPTLNLIPIDIHGYLTIEDPRDFRFKPCGNSPCSDSLGEHMTVPLSFHKVYLLNFSPARFHHMNIVGQRTLLPVVHHQHPAVLSEKSQSRGF